MYIQLHLTAIRSKLNHTSRCHLRIPNCTFEIDLFAVMRKHFFKYIRVYSFLRVCFATAHSPVFECNARIVYSSLSSLFACGFMCQMGMHVYGHQPCIFGVMASWRAHKLTSANVYKVGIMFGRTNFFSYLYAI